MHRKLKNDISELKLEIKKTRENGGRIVFTTGVFDVLHVGHGRFLEEAKKFGDFLVVGVDCDSLVRQSKGPERPINRDTYRAYLISIIEFVDATIIFSSYNEILFAIQPDIVLLSISNPTNNPQNRKDVVDFVNGYGGQVKFVESPVPEESSTKICRRIIANHAGTQA